MEKRMMKNIDILLESMDLDRALNFDAKGIKAAYLANVLAALILLRAKDRSAKHLLSDHQHKNLKSVSPSMSLVNYWGAMLYHSKEKGIAKYVKSSETTDLTKVAGRILRSAVHPIHDAIALWNESCDWSAIAESLRVITLRLPMRTPRINRIRTALEAWDSLSSNDKNSVINDALMFLLEADLHSHLTSNLKALATRTLVKATLKTPNISAASMVKMFEDDAGATTAGDVGGGNALQPADFNQMTTSANIAPVPKLLFKGIIKRTRRVWKKKRADK
jgi:hypothetical protein